jgi:DNA-binding Lrp family transcriptional regulator
MQLDRIDRCLLALLAKDGRLSNKQLAAAAGLAESTCHERLKVLRNSGVIRGTHADIIPGAFGIGLEALFFIRLATHSRSCVEALIRETLALDGVRSAYLITGRYDLVVQVAVLDTNALKEFALDHFTSRPEVTGVETSVIFEYGRRAELPNLIDS